ncbi:MULTISPECIES: recombinase family protein [Paenibacillus]|uniref:recombinase family protein n=1 Tax=Paenibacillus TaxID=44249 RepID=UPI0006495B50|nr:MULTISPECIES: recombinase family protein [Paenibacillus]KLU58125.1 hypothetical protein EL84_02060 [Paenibacillus sp. VT-400]WFA83412.1 recombinase family protein [Paenibacillus amylolyticus]
MNKHQKIAIYVRTARAAQNKGEYQSVEHQRAICLNFVEEQFGKDAEVELFIDNDVSGTSLNRNRLQQLLCEINNGNVQAVVAYDIKTISRSVRDLYNLTNKLNEANVPFVTVTHGEYDQIQLRLLEYITQKMREDMSKRIKSALKHKTKKAQ